MMSTDILAMTTLQHDRWLDAWQQSEEDASPFLHPAYARAVARSGLPVIVGMDNGLRGFLPLQRSRNTGTPVGGRLADCTGALWPEDLQFDGPEMLRACRLSKWVLANSTGVVAQTGVVYKDVMSPFMDISRGFDGWLDDMQHRNSTTKRQVLRKARKLIREQGELRIERRTGDLNLLQQLLCWKGEQRRRSGSVDLFQQSWARTLACDVAGLTEDGCHGALDALYAGDALLAVHLGLQAGKRLHWWIPAYNEEYARYSPGMILLFELARQAYEQGISRIDLGPGDERYKQNVANGMDTLRKSAQHREPLGQALLRVHQRVHRQFQGTTIAHSIKRAQRGLRKQITQLPAQP